MLTLPLQQPQQQTPKHNSKMFALLLGEHNAHWFVGIVWAYRLQNGTGYVQQLQSRL